MRHEFSIKLSGWLNSSMEDKWIDEGSEIVMRPTFKARKIVKSNFLWSVPYLATNLNDPFY